MAIHIGRVNNSGGENQQGPYVTETWQVIEDTGDACGIGPVTVRALTSIPKVGQPYIPETGCDAVDINLVCTQVDVGEVRRDEREGHCWREVTVRYGVDTSRPNGGPGQPNANQPDPILWVPELELSVVNQKREVDQLPFMGAFLSSQYYENGSFGSPNPPFSPCFIGTVVPPEGVIAVTNDFMTRDIGKLAMVASTSGEQFNPRESLEFGDLLIRYSFYTTNYDPSGVYNCYRGIGVNDDDITLSVSEWSFTMALPKHTAKLKNILGRPGHRQWRDAMGAIVERYFWKTTIEIQVRQRGWYIDKLNVGHQRPARGNAANAPDGLGGEWSYNDDFFDGMAPVETIKGPDGQPVTSPVHLGINGQPLLNPEDPWILRYVDGYLMDFTAPGLNLPLAP